MAASEGNEESIVRVTTRDIYDAVQKLREEVAPLVKAVPDHEERIRTLEKWAYALPPTVIASGISLVLAFRK